MRLFSHVHCFRVLGRYVAKLSEPDAPKSDIILISDHCRADMRDAK